MNHFLAPLVPQQGLYFITVFAQNPARFIAGIDNETASDFYTRLLIV